MKNEKAYFWTGEAEYYRSEHGDYKVAKMAGMVMSNVTEQAHIDAESDLQVSVNRLGIGAYILLKPYLTSFTKV